MPSDQYFDEDPNVASAPLVVDVTLPDIAFTMETDRGVFSHALRQSRNIVHPWEQARLAAEFDEGTCKVCWQVLNASVEDLLA